MRPADPIRCFVLAAVVLTAASAGAQVSRLPPVDDFPPFVPTGNELPPLGNPLPPPLPAPRVNEALPPASPAPATPAPATPAPATPAPAKPAPAKPAEVAPLVEAAPVYTWYQPGYYFDPEIWDGSIQLGINGSHGNSENFNINAGFTLKREYGANAFDTNLKYANSEANSKQVQHFGILNAGLERKYQETPWSVFAKSQVQVDQFQAYDWRLVLNSGLSYRMFQGDVTKLKFRFGSGVSREFGGPNDEWSPEAVFGYDFEQALTSRQKVKVQFDYFPNWGDFSDYRLVSDVGWEVLLDEVSNLSLKIGYVNRYDSTPSGSKPSDVNYVMLLLWKL